MHKERQAVTITAADGLKLEGYLFAGDIHQAPKAAVLVACATGVSQRFYFAFAQWLCDQGFSVLTFDYRGIGKSLHGKSVANSPVKKQEWGELDMTAAFDWLCEKYPDLPKHIVGHSAGGLLFGLMPNFERIASVVAIGYSTGHLPYISFPYRLFAYAFLKIYVPLSAKTFGYVPAKRLGMGEDLPSGVASQWALWCSRQGYVGSALGGEILVHHYDRLTMPMMVLNMTDDPVATPRNVTDMHKVFPRAKITEVWIQPSDYRIKAIGHIGFFRKANKILWSKVSQWLDKTT
jgi:predicted alpha/beta hydrolase